MQVYLLEGTHPFEDNIIYTLGMYSTEALAEADREKYYADEPQFSAGQFFITVHQMDKPYKSFVQQDDEYRLEKQIKLAENMK